MPLPKVDLIGELFDILGVSKPAAKTVAPKAAAAKPVAKPPTPPSGYTVTPAGQPPGNPVTPPAPASTWESFNSAAPPAKTSPSPTTIITKEDIEAAKWLKENAGHNVKPGQAAVDAAKSMGWTGLSETPQLPPLSGKPTASQYALELNQQVKDGLITDGEAVAKFNKAFPVPARGAKEPQLNPPDPPDPPPFNVYHGTNAAVEANALDPAFARNKYEPATFFTDDEKEAAKYGKNVLGASLDPKHGLTVNKDMFDFFAKKGDPVQKAIDYAKKQYQDYVVFDLPGHNKTYAVFNKDAIKGPVPKEPQLNPPAPPSMAGKYGAGPAPTSGFFPGYVGVPPSAVPPDIWNKATQEQKAAHVEAFNQATAKLKAAPPRPLGSISTQAVQPFPLEKMREYTPKELDWEYSTEYLKYAKPHFPDLFKSRQDFQAKYDAAPLAHLTLGQLKKMENSAAYSGINKGEKWVHERFGHRRDTAAIIEALRTGKTAPPIVIRDGARLHLMSGQTRIAAGLALRHSIPVKIIDVGELSFKSPEARQADAAALGYTTPAFKGVRHDKIDRVVDMSKATEGGVFSAGNPELANQYAFSSGLGSNDSVLPLLLNTQDYMVYNAKGKVYSSVNSKVIEQAKKEGAKGVVVLNVLDHPGGATPAPGHPNLGPQTVYITIDPVTMRSKHARFDPAKANINDLLASGLAYAVPPAMAAALMGGDEAKAEEGGASGYEVTPASGAVSSGYEVRPAANQRSEEGYTVAPAASRETEVPESFMGRLGHDIAQEIEEGRAGLEDSRGRRERKTGGFAPGAGIGTRAEEFYSILSNAASMAFAPVTGAVHTMVGRPLAQRETARMEEKIGEPYPGYKMPDQTEAEEASGKEITGAASMLVPGMGLVAGPGKIIKSVAGIRDSAVIKGFEKLFSPTTVDKNAKDAEALIRGATGGAARDSAATAAAMEPFHRTINALPDADRLRFIDHVEGGGAGITGLPPELQALGQSMRDAFELRAAKLTSLPSTATTHFIDDYFPHFWQDPSAAAAFAKDFGAKGASKQGSGASLKARSIPTIADGINAGLVPLTTDPIEATMRYVSSMDRFIASTQVLDTGKLTGHIKYIKPRVYGASGHPDSFKVPDGWVKLNGRGAVNGAGAQAYAPEGFARVYNNFIDRGVHDGQWGGVYDATLLASNAVTGLELGLSAFHAVTMANEAMVSRATTGIHDIVGGTLGAAGEQSIKRVLRGTGNYVTAPLAPITSYLRGRTLERVYLGQNPGSPNMARITDLLEKAGGRGTSARHAKDYQFSAAGSYFKAWRQGALKMQMATAAADIKAHPIVGTARQAAAQIGRIMSTSSAWLFEGAIPRLKNGAFYDAMHAALEANPAATYDQQVKMARDIWDSIDNRFGEMVDDNIFWNQTMKQTAKLGLRSYSWGLGTTREIGGGVKHQLSGEWSQRAAYIVALPMQVALVNAVYQKVMTGKNPESVQDLIGGQTGGEASLRIPSTRPFGRSATSTVPERVSVPGYQKDVLGWYENWQQEAFNKVAKLPRMALELLLRNKDWQDNPIISGDDKAPPYLQQIFKYVAESMTPIALQGPLKGHKEGSAITTPQQLAGLRPAHPAVQDPEGYARQQRNIAANAYKRKQALEKRRDRAYQGVD